MKRLLVIFIALLPYCTLQAQISVCLDTLTFDVGHPSPPVELIIDTTNFHHNVWQIGHPNKTGFDTAYSYPNVIVTDTTHLYPSNDTSVFYIKLNNHCYFAWWVESLNFYYKTDIRNGTKLKIEIAGDSLIWYNITDTPYLYNQWVARDTSVINQNTATWKYFSANVAEFPEIGFHGYKSDSVQFRFTMISDTNSSTANGWIIDNLNLGYYWESYVKPLQQQHYFELSPNPSSGIVNVHTIPYEPGNITIYNMSGLCVYKTSIEKENILLKMSLPDGLYIVKFQSTHQNLIRKLAIKN